jgi:HK97 gp10 family phage protein
MSIEFNGLEGLIDKLEAPVSMERMERAMMRACLIVERSAKEKCPNREGFLADSITSEVVREGDDIEGIVFTPLEYAPYVEYGTGLYAENGNGRKDVPWAYEDEKTGELIWTSGQHPQPYMRPALDENREDVKRVLQEGLL